jgi:hypothetical protein
MVYFPHWFPVLVFAILAVVPWGVRRRFSLRTALIAVTLVVVLEKEKGAELFSVSQNSSDPFSGPFPVGGVGAKERHQPTGRAERMQVIDGFRRT